jgi:hypothetical protein
VSKKNLKQLIEDETDASERTKDLPLSDRAHRKGTTHSVVYSVRLTPEQTRAIQHIAEEAGVPASALVRDWVLQGLEAEQHAESVDTLVEVITRDVARLRRQLGRPRAS